MRVWRKSDSQPVVINTSQYDDELFLKFAPTKTSSKRKLPKKVLTNKSTFELSDEIAESELK